MVGSVLDRRAINPGRCLAWSHGAILIAFLFTYGLRKKNKNIVNCRYWQTYIQSHNYAHSIATILKAAVARNQV